jgi:hypothetical protein
MEVEGLDKMGARGAAEVGIGLEGVETDLGEPLGERSWDDDEEAAEEG